LDVKPKQEGDIRKPKVISNDVSEGRTVFIKNIPFSASNDDLKTCMEQFGPVIYALICMDPVTEHSKGTAFVKFRVCHYFICGSIVCGSWYIR
jgi:nucleolar protein 4